MSLKILKNSGQGLEQPDAIPVFYLLWAQGWTVTLELPFNINFGICAATQRAENADNWIPVPPHLLLSPDLIAAREIF